MGKNLIFIGAGGHARSIFDSMSKIEKECVIGYVDITKSDYMSKKSIKYLGKDDYIFQNYANDEVELILGLSYLGKSVSTDLRNNILDKFSNYSFYTFVSERSYVSEDATIGSGTVILNNVHINSECIIGKNCVINNNVLIEHDCEIGESVQISPGALILGGAKIGDNCFIGAGVILRDATAIVKNCKIGMGSIITKDILESGTYIGHPIAKL
jgi:sugar O-acyltransferase (sialic acid O-acetyltransferase NeuD family)